MEVRRGLVRREAQIGGADLDQFAARSQSGQRQRRIGTGGDHQVQPRGQVVEEEGHSLLDVARVDDVVVVEHEHELVRQRRELVDDERHGKLGDVRAGRA